MPPQRVCLLDGEIVISVPNSSSRRKQNPNTSGHHRLLYGSIDRAQLKSSLRQPGTGINRQNQTITPKVMATMLSCISPGSKSVKVLCKVFVHLATNGVGWKDKTARTERVPVLSTLFTTASVLFITFVNKPGALPLVTLMPGFNKDHGFDDFYASSTRGAPRPCETVRVCLRERLQQTRPCR